MDLVEFDDDVANYCAALFKTVEAFRGTFFFSTSVELKTKGRRGGRLALKLSTQTRLCL